MSYKKEFNSYSWMPDCVHFLLLFFAILLLTLFSRAVAAFGAGFDCFGGIFDLRFFYAGSSDKSISSSSLSSASWNLSAHL